MRRCTSIRKEARDRAAADRAATIHAKEAADRAAADHAKEQAEKVIRDLEQELENLKGRTDILNKQQQQVSYAARTGDKSARAKLNTINGEISTNDSEIKIIAAALIEAISRLGSAEQHAALKADQAKAQQIRELQAAFIERLEVIDEACADIAS